MRIEDATPGRRVCHEVENNGPIWRGTVKQNDGPPVADGLVWVKWDGELAAHLIHVDVLEPVQ
jgi:hypothetical protein